MRVINRKFDSKLKEIIKLHNITKYYILLGEEIDSNFNSYIQPVKEFRDSYEHILRIFKKALFENTIEDEYVEAQIQKALGHEYRAFFDVADWFSMICRDAAYDAIINKKNSIDKIIEKWPEYPKCVRILEGSGKQIADIRNEKDVWKASEIVNDYQRIMQELYQAMMYVKEATILVDFDQ